MRPSIVLKLAVLAALATPASGCGQTATASLPANRPAQAERTGSAAASAVHIMPVYGGIPSVGASGVLDYYGGTAQTAQKIYVDLWGWQKYGDPKGIKPVLTSFYSNVGGSKWFSTTTQYYQIVSGKKTDIKNDKNEYVEAIDDEYNPVPLHPTDAQIQTEAKVLVVLAGYNPNYSYVVATPHGRSSNGFGTKWCAYHSAFEDLSTLISYTNLPYMTDAGGSCGANFNGLGELAGVTIVSGHELAESQTDPGLGFDGNLGWFDKGDDEEIADLCAWDSTTSDQPFGSKTFPVQPLYSDDAGKCVLTGPKGP